MKRALRKQLQVAVVFGLVAFLLLSVFAPSAPFPASRSAVWTAWGISSSLAADHASGVMAPSIRELEQGIADRVKRVEEFRFIQEEAKKMGVRAYLFGGTAAGYAHYVKWDIQREKGDTRFQSERFDYDYASIFRSTQDLDIVIDGDPTQAQKLQSALEAKYPHLQGGKTAWEVRLLNRDMGDKQAILNNPDFMNQHTDSNSTGMIELTQPKPGEAVVRDVRDWASKEPHFLKDVQEGALHYYFSPLHETTKFAKEGRNPPIISAIRYLTKAFQYDLKLRPEDLANIKKVIDEFDPKQDVKNDYVRFWIEKNGKKLVQNAVNIETALDTLEKLGLKQKLTSLKGDKDTLDSLAWWLNREPLRAHPIGRGSGKTAKEMGLDEIAHDTNSYLAYESITRSHMGDPNVLVSRDGNMGESAVHGNGFYTKVGSQGASSSIGGGLSVRFHLSPDAREGSDFVYLPKEKYVIVKNRAAIRVIPESLKIEPLEFFKMLSKMTPKEYEEKIGMIEKMNRRVSMKMPSISNADYQEISGLFRRDLANAKPLLGPVGKQWFAMPFSTQDAKLVNAMMLSGHVAAVAINVLTQPHWKGHPEFVRVMLQDRDGVWIHRGDLAYLVTSPHWLQERPEWVRIMLDRKDPEVDRVIAVRALWQPEAAKHPDWFVRLLARKTVDRELARSLDRSHWKDHPEFVEELVQRGSADAHLLEYVLPRPQWQNHPEWVSQIIERGLFDEDVAHFILTQPFSKDHPEWLEALKKAGKVSPKTWEKVLALPHWQDYQRNGLPQKPILPALHVETDWEMLRKIHAGPFEPSHYDWVKKMIESGQYESEIIGQILTQEPWQKHPELVETLLKSQGNELFIIHDILTKPQWNTHPEWVERLIKNGWDDAIAMHVLSKPHWKNHPELFELLKQRGLAHRENLETLSKIFAVKEPEVKPRTPLVSADDPVEEHQMLNKIHRGPYEDRYYSYVKKSIQGGRYDELIAKFILSQEPWQKHPDLVLELLKKNDADHAILNHVLMEPHWQHHPEFVRALIEKGTVNENIDMFLLKQPHWRNHPVLRRLAGEGRLPSVANLQAAIRRGELFQYLPSEVVDCLQRQIAQKLK
jgi:hypothetical protein